MTKTMEAVEENMDANHANCGQCHKCVNDAAWMILCPKCGNKRCPHATDHALACTRSNEPGQKGSVYGEPDVPAKPMSVLAEAEALVTGNREKTYGGPHVNFPRIAAVWSAILGHPVTAEQVCLCMAGLKLVRLSNNPQHRDSQVDLCGYVALVEMLQGEKP